MVIILTAGHPKENTEEGRSLWTPCTQILGVCTTFTEMCGNGWKMAGTTIIMVPQRTELHGYLVMNCAFCGVVLGSTMLGSLARRFASGTDATGTTAGGSVWSFLAGLLNPLLLFSYIPIHSFLLPFKASRRDRFKI